VDPEQILLLTFTRRAAREMLQRASLVLDERCGRVSGGTFHSFASTLLRRFSKHLGLHPNFTILDRSDSEDVIQLIRTELGFDKIKKRFPRKKTLQQILSACVNKQLEIEEVLEKSHPHFLDFLGEIEALQARFNEYKLSLSLLDYDDLLVYLKLLLSTEPRIREEISSKYRFVMVDEYQDTNCLQARIASLLSSVHKNLMVVGDDSQSIYSFRGADFRNIMGFPKQNEGCKVIKLEENYRSTQPILDLTNEVIAGALRSHEKVLYSRKKSEQKPVYVETFSENEQSRFVVQRVLELREEGVALNEIAVLFRNGWHSNDLEVELSASGIPFVKYGGIKFVEASHIKDILAHLRVCHNPMDSVSWLRILLLLEGVGPQTAKDLIERIVTVRGSFDALVDKDLEKRKFFPLLEKLRDTLVAVRECHGTLGEMILIIDQYYRPILKNHYDDFQKRIPDIDSFEAIAERYRDLEEFLVEMSLEPPERSQTDVDPLDKDQEQLTLSTIHSAKGLEWHSVLILHLVDGFLPSERSLESPEEVDEERRLLYVAATRARENLYLLKPSLQSPGRGNYYQSATRGFQMVSRFLTEGDILNDKVEQWRLVPEDKPEKKDPRRSTQELMDDVHRFLAEHSKKK
jgi:DNA helicase-2/ATP-dependent DNA helicase PcrA